jgi:hypothetical protein
MKPDRRPMTDDRRPASAKASAFAKATADKTANRLMTDD